MSFTSIVKNEVSKLETTKTEKIAELSAMIRTTRDPSENIKISTENASVARRIFSLLKELYQIGVKVSVKKGYNYNKNYNYLLETTQKKDLILSDLSLLETTPKEYIYADEDLKRAYLRGVFLGSGSINDPKKSRYHLEFLVDSEKYALFIYNLLNDFFLNAKYLKRENKYMVYLKEAEKIGDFLRIINATNAVFYYEDIRIYRDHKNMTNRLNNCEQANVDKMILTASKQIKEIEILEQTGLFEQLDDKLKEVAIYRKKYPEASLLELSEIISIETSQPITKSGVHHRLKKIQEIVAKIKKE